MIKLDKNLFRYAIIMICAVLLLVFAALFSQSRVSEIEEEYKKEITESQKKTGEYQEKLVRLEEDNKILKEKVENYESELNRIKQESSERTEYYQQMKILSDIFVMIKNGDKEGAKAELLKLEDFAMDETAENYKNALEEILR